MELKEKIDAVIDKIKSDKEFAAKFISDPIKAVESLIGIDLPHDQINKVIEGVKANVSLANAARSAGLVKALF